MNNYTGLPNSNVEGDLKVEHQNLEFKTGLLNLAGTGSNFSKQKLDIYIQVITQNSRYREWLKQWI